MKAAGKRGISITTRLLILFTSLIVAFALILSVLYNTLMRTQMIRHYSQVMQRDAHAIAQNLSELVAPSGFDALDETRMIVSEETLAPYLTLTELLTDCNVYLVDINHDVTGSFSGVVQTLKNPLLPLYLEQTIALGFMGKTPFIQANYQGELHLTASMPVMNVHSQVLGVVVLEATLRELGYAQLPDSAILIMSCVIAFSVAVVLAMVFSRLFTSPIARVEHTAQLLAEGRYETRMHMQRGDEVGTLASSMDVLAQRLEEARQKDQEHREQQQLLFSNISHELRTPVTVIRGSLEALRDGVVAPGAETQAYYDQMIRESQWLQRLIRDLLELSRLQNSEFVLSISRFDLCDLLGDVAMSARALCEQKNLRFVCEEPVNHFEFEGDYTRLRQMLLAVVDNAVKFTPEGKQVYIHLEETEPVIVIGDDGVGIEPEELKYIFDRFHATHSPAYDSTGLGLSIVREAARRHGVVIDVQSTPGKGTAFRFTFPQAAVKG